MEQDFDKKYDLTLTEKIVAYFFVALSLYFFIYLFAAKPIAILKSYNSDNILEGCLYYEGVGAKFMVKGRIDGKSDMIYNMYVKSFPYAKKSFSFNKRNHCYKVKYIVVDFNHFSNSNFLKQYFLYDYIGE